MADEQRIAVLEQHVRALYEQIGALRQELRTQDGRAPRPAAQRVETAAVMAESAPPAPPLEAPQSAAPQPEPMAAPMGDHVVPRSPVLPPRTPRAARSEPGAPQQEPEIDLENLLGRYGTIAVASLAILMGVGTFLSWAIEHGLLGPTVRVVLGFIGAGIVAGVGFWVRKNRDVRFGNVLLALSLAIVHVDSWAAGPYLQIMSAPAALTIAALASAALAALALTSDELTLFALGFAGALAAPFVTAREPGSVILLLTYGWVVIALGMIAIRERDWEPVLWLTVLGAAVYVAAGAEGPHAVDNRWVATHAPVIFAFACAAAALFFARDALRSKLALTFIGLACLATLGYSLDTQMGEAGVSFFGTLAAYLIARELETDERWLVVGNIILPLGFLLATIYSSSDNLTQTLAALALTAASSFLAWEDEEEREHHLLVSAIASAIAIGSWLSHHDTRCILALSLHVALYAMVLRATRARLLVPPLALELLILSGWTLVLLMDRTPYTYTPFATLPSLCALAAVGAWGMLAFALKPTPTETDPEQLALFQFTTALALATAFFWARQELDGAWSADKASFALIMYYALTGLALIYAGRVRAILPLRGAGLALAFYAGFKALVETFTIDAVALRVGARILVGVFLAAVAYWYRTPAEPEVAAGESPHFDPGMQQETTAP